MAHELGIDLADIRGFWTLPPSDRDAAFARLRDEEPIRFFAERPIRSGGKEVAPAGPGFWAITRHDDIAEASRRPELFSSAQGTSIFDQPPEMLEFFGGLLNLDNPEHARLRRIVQRGFTPRSIQRLDDELNILARDIVRGARELGEFDFVEAVAAKLPLVVICNLMGIPLSFYDEVLRTTNVILSAGDPGFVAPGVNPLQAYMDAAATLASIANDVAEHRRRNPADDLISTLVHAEVDGEQLNPTELATFFVLLCTAGNETTRNATTHGVLALHDFPREKSRWADDFVQFEQTAVEEIVRWASPVIYFRRTVTTDGARLGDHAFVEGDKVALFYTSANRDERVFDDPYVFDVGRNPNPHVGFGGAGPHFCLGANLARRELGVVFRELFAQLPDLTVTGEPERLRSNFVNGIKHLPCKC